MSDADNIDTILVSSGEKSAAPRHAKEQVPDGPFSLLIGTVSEQAEERRRYRASVVRGDYNRGGRPPQDVYDPDYVRGMRRDRRDVKTKR